MSDTRRTIPANPPRWKPNPDPQSIHVPGLDTTAPVPDQIEQMEQLITIKLQVGMLNARVSWRLADECSQNIDENFSKIHNLLANKLLPAVKRYAVGTEPVREAAKVRHLQSRLLQDSAIFSSGPHSMNKPHKSEYRATMTILP